jgi:PIN like domain
LSAPRDALVFFTDRDLGTRFPDILIAAGLTVRRHRDLFPPDCPDEVWLQTIGREGWIAVSHDARIRYKPNELAAVVRHRVRLLVVIGKAPYPELAKHFVATAPKVAEFVAQHAAPWIAKLYRPSATELAKNPDASGSVSLWYPPKKPD